MIALASLLTPPCPPDAEPDVTWFLDRGRRQHRLRRSGSYVVASHRDGRALRWPWPSSEPVPQHESFAARIFAICEKAAEREPGGL